MGIKTCSGNAVSCSLHASLHNMYMTWSSTKWYIVAVKTLFQMLIINHEPIQTKWGGNVWFYCVCALITRWKFGQSNRVAPSADAVICNKITILSSSSHPQNSCGSVCDVLPLLAGFHHDIKSYMQIYEYTTTHARTMHLLSLCNGAVFVLYLPSL